VEDMLVDRDWPELASFPVKLLLFNVHKAGQARMMDEDS
jgi:hypothetical protein